MSNEETQEPETVEETEESKAPEESEESEEEEMSEEMLSMMAAMMGSAKDQRIVGIYGDIDEEKASAACAALISFANAGKEPIEMFVSTNGGSADEMYALVDMIQYTQKLGIEIQSVGIGKVMSAGIMVLASGTKGKRKAGKNTRFMLHSLQSGTQGSLPSMRVDMRNFADMQEKYIQALSALINLNYKQLKKIINKNTDTYFTAEEAIEMGIIDEIL